jgi:hypothetical protein
MHCIANALSKLSALRTAGDASDVAAVRARRPRSVPCCPCGEPRGLAGSDVVCRRRTSASNGDAKAPPPGERWPATAALCGLPTCPTTGVAVGAANSGESEAADRVPVDRPPSWSSRPLPASRRVGVPPGSCLWLVESAAVFGKVRECPEPEERYCSGLAVPAAWAAAASNSCAVLL